MEPPAVIDIKNTPCYNVKVYCLDMPIGYFVPAFSVMEVCYGTVKEYTTPPRGPAPVCSPQKAGGLEAAVWCSVFDPAADIGSRGDAADEGRR